MFWKGAPTPHPSHPPPHPRVATYPIIIPHFEWTLEFVLPRPLPMHQFEQSPVCIEVKDRNPDPDALLYTGPNVCGGYPHPTTGKLVTREEHEAMVAMNAERRAAHDPRTTALDDEPA